MARKSVSQISNETNGKRLRSIEARGGAVTIRFADDTELRLTSSAPIAVEYGESGEEEKSPPSSGPVEPGRATKPLTSEQ